MTMPLASAWEWWMGSGAGLGARIAIGGAFFAVLAVVDLARNGKDARRWKEYLFLVFGAAAAMAYGAANDCITCRISWEYFYYGKGLEDQLGPRIPPDALALAWGAMKVGVQSSWSAGLLVAAAMLMANNPRPGRASLGYGRLIGLTGIVFAITAAVATLGGVVGHFGGLRWVSPDLSELWDKGLFRPGRFLAVFGVHLGGYAGALLGTIYAVWRIRRDRATT